MIWRILLSLAAAPGLTGGALLSLTEWREGAVCPLLGPMPACYVVTAGYALILVAAWTPSRISTALFGLGFLPVFLLAATGATLELVQGGVCPRAAGNVPQCFYSLALSLLCLASFLLLKRSQRTD